MHPRKRTGQLRFRGTGATFIVALDKSPGTDGKLPQRAFTIPESISHPLLLIIPDESQATGIRTIVLDDNPVGFHWGAYRFLNATPMELAVKLEKKIARIPTGWKPVDIDLGGEPRGISAAVALVKDLKNPLYSAVWEYDKNIRTLVFMLPGTDPRLSPVMFKAIPEDKISVKEEQAATSAQAEP